LISLRAAHARHHQIEYDEIYLLAVDDEPLDRLHSIAGQNDGVAESRQYGLAEKTQMLFVFRNEHGLGASAHLRIAPLDRRSGAAVSGGQINSERGSASRSARDVYQAAVLFDYTVDDGKSKPGSSADLFSGEERLEDPLHNLRIHSNPGVADDQLDITAGFGPRAFETELFIELRIVCFYDQLPAVRHGVARVYRQVHNHLLDLNGIGKHG